SMTDRQPASCPKYIESAERVVVSPPYSARCKTPFFSGAYLVTELQDLSQGSPRRSGLSPAGILRLRQGLLAVRPKKIVTMHGKIEGSKSHILRQPKERMTEYSFTGVDDFGEVLNRLVMHAQNLNGGLVCSGVRE